MNRVGRVMKGRCLLIMIRGGVSYSPCYRAAVSSYLGEGVQDNGSDDVRRTRVLTTDFYPMIAVYRRQGVSVRDGSPVAQPRWHDLGAAPVGPMDSSHSLARVTR